MAAASLWCNRLPCSYRLMISSRQFTVGAMLSLNGASGNKTLQDPVRKLFVQKIKVNDLDIILERGHPNYCWKK